ncbi:GntR family transcriptional regulator [Ammoniphilus sp. YIM 78166]|uniref:GntR family transcriptional regulator n=1 Tax=Ammoniphilus sp. YIM 78166 TaxID=1644106 RepID=UPI00106F857B|nr:GntR family transcriptional regulator [Ammoniphilus sp. YIM 78166]
METYADIIDQDIDMEGLTDIPSFVPLREVVFQAIRKAILDGKLKPGQLLSENKIAAKLSVSRTPVREALRTLETENLVTMLPGRKVIVSIPTIQDIIEIYEIRLMVETEGLKAISPNDHEIIQHMESCLAQSEVFLADNNIQGLREINTQFHMVIVSALKNRRLKQFLDSLNDTFSLFRYYSLMDPEWAEAGVEEHHQILEALKAGNPEEAVRILRHHLSTAQDILVSMFSKRGIHKDEET